MNENGMMTESCFKEGEAGCFFKEAAEDNAYAALKINRKHFDIHL